MSEKHRQAFSHGGDVASYAHRKKTILDFSANTSPLGLPFAGRLALVSCCAGISQYPDPYCRRLTRAISLREQISDSRIVCGNGATELIYAAAHAVQPRRALIVEPAFSEYRRALLIAGCSESAIDSFMLTADTEFSLTEELCAELCRRLTGIDMLFVCSPSNPAGTVIPFALLERIAAACAANHVFMVVDSCFMPFVTDDIRWQRCLLHSGADIIILKAFTKFYGMAGLRLGYALCSSEQAAENIVNVLPPWNVSFGAQCAGTAVLDSRWYERRLRRLITKERQYLYENLSTLGFYCVRGRANFLLCTLEPLIQTGILPPGFDLPCELLKHNILVRRCADYAGLGSTCFRIAVRRHRDNKRLIQVVKKIIAAVQRVL